MTLNITEIAAQVEAECVRLESEITALRAQKATINEQIKKKTEELTLAQSMRPRRKTTPVVPADTSPVE